MGCGHSVPGLVEPATTLDELASPVSGPATVGDAQRNQSCNAIGQPSNSFRHPNTLSDGTDAAPSSAGRIRPQRSSPCELVQSSRFTGNSRNISIGSFAQDGASGFIDSSIGGAEPPGCAADEFEPPDTAEAIPFFTFSPESATEITQAPQGLADDPAKQTSRSAALSVVSPAQYPQPPPQPRQRQQQQQPVHLLQAMHPMSKGHLLSCNFSARPQLPALHPAGPIDQQRMLVLIVWDIENVRCPRDNGSKDSVLTPAKVLSYIKQHFVYDWPGREEYRTVAAVTPKSLSVIRKKYPDFVEQVVPELTLLVASAKEPKRDADEMLKKEVYRFVSEHAHITRMRPGQFTVVLISGDEDFLGPVQVALNSGFAVELVHHDTASWALRSQQGYARPPLLWADFLKQRSRADHVNLPYNRK